MTATSTKSVLAAFTLAIAGSYFAPLAWPAETIRIAQAEIDMRPSAELTDPELKTRMKFLRRLVKRPQPEGKPDYQAMLKADQRELKARNKKAKAAEPVQQQTTQEETAAPAKKEKKKPAKTEPAQQEPEQSQTAVPTKKKKKPAAVEPAQQEPAQPAQQVQPKAAEEPEVSTSVNKVLTDQRPAADLSEAELRQRIRSTRQLMKDETTTKEQRAALATKRKADAGELNSRVAATTGVSVQPGELPAEVAKVLGDKRPAADLDDKSLRARIKQTRALLAIEGLDDGSSDKLRALLARDRQEIRGRVAARDAEKQTTAGAVASEQGKANDLPAATPGSLTVDDLVRDERPGADLTTAALQRRIEANRTALGMENLSAGDRADIKARLKADRADMRGRLGERRERRKKNRLSSGEKIAIAAGVGLVAGAIIASRPTIAVAEAYDDELEVWLVAPPLVKVQPQYRVEDFRTQPRLRYTVPGVEVDTVRFGFGEGFLREEEVPKLERVGEVMERIVASNPDEVYLIEGHTDAVGSPEANQVLSEQRANAVRDALVQYFAIADQNLAVVGYGESYLKIPTQAPEVENRRVTLRRITPLLRKSSVQ